MLYQLQDNILTRAPKSVVIDGTTYINNNDVLKQLGYKGFKGYKFVSLPDTKYNYTSKSIDPKRLLVAQGLCFSADFYSDIKKYYAETEIEDIVVSVKKDDIEYISKDMC